MSDPFAVTRLFDAVVTRFAEEGTGVANLFGWRESAQVLELGDRIAWIPGDPNGALGAMLPAKQPGRNPRPLATLDELVTCEITASDETFPEDERAQYVAARLVYDAWFRAIFLADGVKVRIVNSGWITSRKERRNGAALRIVIAVQSMIPDKALETASTDVRAVIDVDLLDNTEQVVAPEEEG